MLKRLMLATTLAAGLATGHAAWAETTVTFASWQLEEPGNSDWWKEVIAKFEAENPDIKIEPVYVPFADYLTQMTVRFASNRAPAVIQLSQQLLGAYAAQGWLAPLDDLIAGTDIETDWAAAQNTLSWDGATRGVLVSNSAMMLFYNKQLLEDAGVAVPDSWESFKAAVGEMTDPDAGVFGLSAVTTEHPTAVEEMHRYTQWGGTSLVKDGQYNLTSPEVIAALDEYRKTVGPNAPLGNNSSVARQLFVDGRTAFLIDGPWVWSWLERATPEMRPNLVMAATPFEPTLAPGGLSLHLSEGLDDETKAAAWKFIQTATEAELQRSYLITTGQPPGRKSPVLTAEDEAAYPHLAVVAEAATNSVPMFPTEEAIRANFAEYSAILMEVALASLSTDRPTEEILTEAQGKLEAAIPLD